MSEFAQDVSEQTPLLAPEPKPITPLPKVQLFLICFLRVTEPIAFLVCFPFINQMLLAVGAVEDEKDVGWPAAVIESVFSVTQLLTVFYWGALSDKIGRKPVLIIGCFGSAISAILFGMSQSFWMMVVTRSINGLMNGNVAVLKCIMAEIADETNESKAFSFFPLCLNIGTLIASYVGGEYAEVAKKHPAIANAFPIFRTYPYLLPCVLAATFPILSGLVSIFFLKETLEPKKTDIEDEGVPLRDLLTRKINAIMFSFGVLSLMGSAMMGLFPLFCFTPTKDGGLGFDEKNIGNAISLRAVAILVVQMVAFPWLQRKMGTYRLYRLMMFLWIPAFLGLPVLNLFARAEHVGWVWSGLTLTIMCGAIGNMAFVCNLLMVNDAAPNRRSLGSINGLSQAVSSAVRILGPGGASVLFAVSIDKHILGGNFVWLVCGLIAIVGVWSGLIL